MKKKQSFKELEKRIKKLENLLLKKENELERIKSVFLMHISHEIRTPMNSIIGFSNLLVNDELTRDQKDLYLQYINSSSESLLNLIDRLIDLAMLEAGQIEIHKEKCSLNELFEGLYLAFNREKHIHEKYSVALLMNKPLRRGDPVVLTDPLRLNQIMSNLLHNALKFTEKGVIEFGYSLDNTETVQFFVKDTGRGISMDEQQNVFDSFRKQDVPSTTDNMGLGLGLAIAKGLVELMEGKIWVEPNIKRGSVFAFKLPLRYTISKTASIHYLKQNTEDDLYISGNEMAI
ncbi:Signal transduction histidine-protein kinase BarA [subsurface metagenome]